MSSPTIPLEALDNHVVILAKTGAGKGQLRSLGFVDYPAPGQVRAEDWLFP